MNDIGLPRNLSAWSLKYGMFSFRRFLKRKNNHDKDVVRSATIANIYEDIENGNVGCHESQMS